MALTVYKQMIASSADLFNVLRQEIGLKANCLPFAVKAIDALSSLGTLSEQEALKAANKFLEDMQTLIQGGITVDDYDKLDFVKRGKTITVSARVEAFLRAAARKGYRITETIIGVPVQDANTTYFEENFHGNDYVYILRDRRFEPDREITPKRLVEGYFKKFICRLDVHDIAQNKRIVQTTCEVSSEEIFNIMAASDRGIYKSYWEKYKKENGYQGNRKVITKTIDTESFWYKWPKAMVEKTVIRQALKRVREVLPELKATIYAFDKEDEVQEPVIVEAAPPIELPMHVEHVNLRRLTAEQKADVAETLELFKANPKLASETAQGIKERLESGEEVQSVTDDYFAAICNIKKSKALWPTISNYFEVAKNEKS